MSRISAASWVQTSTSSPPKANVASAESVNLTSAESNITSTNYGQAASDLAKYQVLSQTGISALAQANSVQQEVLKLMQ